MSKKINQYLDQLEQEHDIRILLACEVGSRAWGFPSPDSDYDVRLLYVHPKDWYLSLEEGRDTIELMLEDREIDIAGWDLRKALRLMLKSNTSLIERLQSTIIYQCDPEFVSIMQSLAQAHYSRVASLHHYLNMGKKSYEEMQAGEQGYRFKSFFYALRAAASCQWILTREEMPPISFLETLNGIEMADSLKEKILLLVELKKTKDEDYLHQGERQCLAFIQESIKMAEQQGGTLPAAPAKSKEALNSFFKTVLA